MVKRAKNIYDISLDKKNASILVASDLHIPFQDNQAVKAFLKYAKVKQPDIVVLNGDMMDFFRLSRFTKGEGRNPMQEIILCRKFLSELRGVCKTAEIYYVLGNHETRLQKYVLEKAPELEAVVEDVFTILKVQEFNIIGCASLTLNNSIVFKHGTLIGSKSGLSAIKEMEKAYMSGVTGHTHRISKFITRKSGRKFVWFESGCLCSLTPEYCICPDWQQGFVEIKITNRTIERSKIIEIENGVIQE